MKLKRSRVKQYFHRQRIVKKDNESGTYEEYEAASVFHGEVWPATGKVQAQMYGEKLSYIRNVKIEGDYTVQADDKGRVHYVYPGGMDVTESDGLCLYVPGHAKPDYRIIAVKPYKPLKLEAEKII